MRWEETYRSRTVFRAAVLHTETTGFGAVESASRQIPFKPIEYLIELIAARKGIELGGIDLTFSCPHHRPAWVRPDEVVARFPRHRKEEARINPLAGENDVRAAAVPDR